ncbi:hypothetical protein OF83DRAFT_1172119 [Amylostereum chailletii]|nr:hypothetical protein OF83DRAFT_1172119 [Amylostereum chailletii]
MSRIVSRFLLPIILFPALSALAFHFLLGHLVNSGAGAQLAAQCPPNAGLYSLTYTNHPGADRTLCILVSIFHAAFDKSTEPVLLEFGGSGAVLLIFPFVESARSGRSFLLSLSTVVAFGLGFQRLGAGIVYPLFWTLIILSGTASFRQGPHSKITQAHAEANLLALFVLAALSAAMFILQDPIVTAVWQVFPVWLGMSRLLYPLFRPSTTKSGYAVTQFTYLLTFFTSAISHITVLGPLVQDTAALKLAFYPPFEVSSPAVTTVVSAAKVFLQWDLYFTLASSMIGCLWFAHTRRQFVFISLWTVIFSLALGPGAAVSAVLMWREHKLNGRRTSTTKSKHQ